MTSLELEPDAPLDAGMHCGSCSRCLDACPTQAIGPGHRIDARKCISYLTIEHAGPIPNEYREAIGNRIYGCDDCLAVCPWNRFADAAAANRAFLPRAELAAPRLADLLKLDDAGFREAFSGSPIKRIGRNRMIRNCLIAAGNSGDEGLVGDVRPHVADGDPVVAEAAAWALEKLESLSFLG
jgi:epoxyqueuosine reductase